MANITDNEREILAAIAESEYGPLNGGKPRTFEETGPVWASCLRTRLAPKSIPGVVASLSKKGLVGCYGVLTESTVELTRAGFDAYIAARTASVDG